MCAYSSNMMCVGCLHRAEGYLGFYKGFSLSMLQSLPNICIVFLVYEMARQAFNAYAGRTSNTVTSSRSDDNGYVSVRSLVEASGGDAAAIRTTRHGYVNVAVSSEEDLISSDDDPELCNSDNDYTHKQQQLSTSNTTLRSSSPGVLYKADTTSRAGRISW